MSPIVEANFGVVCSLRFGLGFCWQLRQLRLRAAVCKAEQEGVLLGSARTDSGFSVEFCADGRTQQGLLDFVFARWPEEFAELEGDAEPVEVQTARLYWGDRDGLLMVSSPDGRWPVAVTRREVMVRGDAVVFGSTGLDWAGKEMATWPYKAIFGGSPRNFTATGGRLQMADLTKIRPPWRWGGAFTRSFYLEEVALPEWLREIPPACFFNCVALWRVGMPPALQFIGKRAFAFCFCLPTLAMPSALEVAEQPFHHSGLEELDMSGSHLSRIEIEGCAWLRRLELPRGADCEVALYGSQRLQALTVGSRNLHGRFSRNTAVDFTSMCGVVCDLWLDAVASQVKAEVVALGGGPTRPGRPL